MWQDEDVKASEQFWVAYAKAKLEAKGFNEKQKGLIEL